jgi:hypothetical protein
MPLWVILHRSWSWIPTFHLMESGQTILHVFYRIDSHTRFSDISNHAFVVWVIATVCGKSNAMDRPFGPQQDCVCKSITLQRLKNRHIVEMSDGEHTWLCMDPVIGCKTRCEI